MALVEECDDFVALLEAGYAGADGFNCACTIGSGDDVVLDREGVLALVLKLVWGFKC
jgi:hypothetical protein